MNPYLEFKLESYKNALSSECFNNGLIGLGSLELNPTEMCSRRCKFCPRHDPSVYKSRNLNMSVETVNTLISQCDIEGFVGDITIAGFGEPMLHPNLPEIITPLKNYITVLITNGDFLTQETLESLIEAGLKKIIVSCYDGKEAKDNFEKLLSGKIPYYVKDLWYDFETVTRDNHFNNRSGLAPIFLKVDGKECYRPFSKLFVDWNGDVLLCSNDWWRKEGSFGNINTNTLREIWFSKRLMDIRKELMEGRRTSKACRDCNCCGVHVGKESFDLWKK